MRDAHHIREADPLWVRVKRVLVTLIALLVLGGTFALGYTTGERVGALSVCDEAADPITRLDNERRSHEALTFYKTLSSGAPRKATPPPALPEPAAPAATATKPLPQALPEPPPATARDAARRGKETAAQTAAPQTARLRPSPVASGKPAPKGAYTLQVSSFKNRIEADTYAAALHRKGFGAYVVPANLVAKGPWYRVRVGSYPSQGQAQEAKAHLAKADIPAWVLKAE